MLNFEKISKTLSVLSTDKARLDIYKKSKLNSIKFRCDLSGENKTPCNNVHIPNEVIDETEAFMLKRIQEYYDTLEQKLENVTAGDFDVKIEKETV